MFGLQEKLAVAGIAVSVFPAFMLPDLRQRTATPLTRNRLPQLQIFTVAVVP